MVVVNFVVPHMSDSFLAAASIRTVDARPRRRRKKLKILDAAKQAEIAELSTLLWSMALSFTQPWRTLLSLPTDAQSLSHLTLRECLYLRGACRALRALTALPEGWADLAAASWAAAQGHDESAAPISTIPGEVQIAPSWMHGASLVDACARVVAWPHRLRSELMLNAVSRTVQNTMLAVLPAAARADAAADVAVETAATAAALAASDAAILAAASTSLHTTPQPPPPSPPRPLPPSPPRASAPLCVSPLTAVLSPSASAAPIARCSLLALYLETRPFQS